MLNKILFGLLVLSVIVLSIMVKNSYQNDTAEMRKQLEANHLAEVQKAQEAKRLEDINRDIDKNNITRECLIGVEAYNRLTANQAEGLQQPNCYPAQVNAPSI